MLSNTKQLDVCQFMKEYENDFLGPPKFGEGVVTHSPNLYFIYNLLPLR